VRNLRELVFYLVSAYDRYGPFSNNQWNQGQPGIYGSIEGVHDTVHGVAGGGGHMSVVPYAAFDPLFWLHHWWVYVSLRIAESGNADMGI
jgi:tyrosinase